MLEEKFKNDLEGNIATAVASAPQTSLLRTTAGLTKRHCAQYTSREFAKYCKEHHVRRSLGRTGICYDNAVSESFFATYKKELIHTRPWPTITDLKEKTKDWVDNYYNVKRRHSYLEYLTPTEFELGFRHLNQLAA